MRDWINLITETASQWPETISGDDLVGYAEEWHHTPEDFDEGDIVHNITSFGTYHLKMIPVTDVKRGMYTIHDDLVDDYAGMESPAPPIIFDPTHRLVIDGNHRVEAAAKRGEHEVLAYVGDPATYDPPQDEDEDDGEWRPGNDW